MRINKDTRGKSFYDIIPEIKGQIDITLNYPGTIRAFHKHLIHTEYIFVIEGELKVRLTHPDEILYLSSGEMVKIIPSRWHGYQVLGDQPCYTLYYESEKWTPEDDLRKPYNAFDNWEREKK